MDEEGKLLPYNHKNNPCRLALDRYKHVSIYDHYSKKTIAIGLSCHEWRKRNAELLKEKHVNETFGSGN